MNPKVNAPPSTPKKIKMNGMLLPWLMSHGLTKLSMLLTPSPHTSMKMPQPVEPWLNSQIAGRATSVAIVARNNRRRSVASRFSASPGTGGADDVRQQA